MTPPPICLTVAGSDSGGGAGIQADLKTFGALGCYGASALTALTAQNTVGVHAVHAPPAEFVVRQLEVVLDDLAVAAIKIGMLASAEIAGAVADCLAARPERPPIVLDPVMVAQSGDPLLADDAVAVIVERLVPLAAVVTPNWPEAQRLVPDPPDDPDALVAAVGATGARAVLLKGGHRPGAEVLDVLWTADGTRRFRHPRIDTPNNHGTGCTLSSAIAAFLARGEPLDAAVAAALDYLAEALRAAYPVGSGAGPVHHYWAQWGAPREGDASSR